MAHHCFFSALTCLLALLLTASCLGNNQALNNYTACAVPYKCGKFADVTFPFCGNHRPPQCGHAKLELTCRNNTTTTIQIDNVTHTVLDVNQETHVLKIARTDLARSLCTQQLKNATLDPSLFEYAANYAELKLVYGCNMNINLLSFDCPVEGIAERTSYVDIGSAVFGVNFFAGVYSCHVSVVVPIYYTEYGELIKGGAEELVGRGFEVRLKVGIHGLCGKCENSGGRCGYGGDGGEEFVCFCQNGTAALGGICDGDGSAAYRAGGSAGGASAVVVQLARSGKKSNAGMKIGLFIGGAVLAAIVLGWLIFYCRQKRKQSLILKSGDTIVKEVPSPRSSKPISTPPSESFTKSIPSYPSLNSDTNKVSSYYGVQVFTYKELEEATDNFDPRKELGDGGFGTVYYGVLTDGREVAVKRLYENNFKRVEQFMNEVKILNNLRHQNLVKLYGCTSKKSRELMLVYEFIPNGTVGDHLHGNRAKSCLLSWPIRLNIAIETADALTYLHKKAIIHRDVKTNNLLLDKDFHVKVADFGLSRLFPKDFTHISTAPQGTPGYVDPEYYQCYQLTEKSDVYSFGVVLIELISSLQAVDTNRHRQDINLSNMAVTKIQNHELHEIVDQSIGFEMNSSVRRAVSLVAELAFRCLQQVGDMRPSMQEVLEALRGIKNEDLNAHKVEIVDMLLDDDESRWCYVVEGKR